MKIINGEMKKILRDYVNRIEKLEQEKENINNDIKALLLDSKIKGFDPLIIKKVIKSKKIDNEDFIEQEELFEIYREAII